MKYAVLLSSLLSTIPVWASCPDVQGIYECSGDNQQSTIAILQDKLDNGQDQLTFVTNSDYRNHEVYLMDGSVHEAEKTNDGGEKATISSSWQCYSDKIINEFVINFQEQLVIGDVTYELTEYGFKQKTRAYFSGKVRKTSLDCHKL